MTNTDTLPSNPDAVEHAINCTLNYELDAPCHFVFMIHVAETERQQLLGEWLDVTPARPSRLHTDALGNRILRLQAPAGPLTLTYRAKVARTHPPDEPDAAELLVDQLPDAVLPDLLPTRYCESDLLSSAALKIFGALPPGYARVQAICDWVHDNIEYRLGSSVSSTTARDVFVQRAGVCRDFAHLAITLCRALGIPARLVCGYAAFDTPPPDFHAVFEAYLGGRWVMFDPSRLAPVDGLIRIATGRDAKDVAFSTIFGPARMISMSPQIERVAAPVQASGRSRRYAL